MKKNFINRGEEFMGIFDNIGVSNTSDNVTITFNKMPESMADFMALPETDLSDPFKTAALTIMAFCYYPSNKDFALEMLSYLRGPRPLSEYDKQFIRDRFMDKDYVPRSYFNGTSPANDYKPSVPYSITLFENPYSYTDQGYAKLYVNSSGADSPRYVQLRLAKDGKWYLWEQFILSDIRQPESSNPWA